jgi:methionyl aminopeptidase
MAISLKTKADIDVMRTGGRILAHILGELAKAVRPGVKTSELDALAHRLCDEANVKPAFLGYNNFPAALCVSVNDEVVHGIPGPRILKDGDVVGLDMGVIYNGWNLDSAVTVVVSPPAPLTIRGEKGGMLAQKLVTVARDAMYLGIEQAREGNHIGDIGYAVQTYVEKHGFGVVRDLVGHGIGKQLHEDPHVPNFGKPGEGPELRADMVICIEPMITAGDWHVAIQPDKWTYKTKDGSLAAHFEHTIAITKTGPEVLTKL